MPIMFILSIFFILAALGVLLHRRTIPKHREKQPVDEYGRRIAGEPTKVPNPSRLPYTGAIVILLGISLLFLVFSCLTIVSTRNVGVVTEFGQPVDRPLDNGLHVKAPWQKVTELDGSIQTDNFVGGDIEAAGGCVAIRIGTEGTACVDNTIRWRIKTDAGSELFKDYRTFDNIRDSLVTRELNAALNDVLADFDPLAAVDPDADTDSGTGGLDEIGLQVTERLTERVGDRVEVYNVLIPLIRYGAKTQERLDAYQEEIANTRIAEQRKATATAEAAANRELSASVSNDPNVLVARCMDTFNEMVREGQAVPAGFSCWPGGGSAVVVPSATTPAPARQ